MTGPDKKEESGIRFAPEMKLLEVAEPKFKADDQIRCLPGKGSKIVVGISDGSKYFTFGDSALCCNKAHPYQGREVVEIVDDTDKLVFYPVENFEKI